MNIRIFRIHWLSNPNPSTANWKIFYLSFYCGSNLCKQWLRNFSPFFNLALYSIAKIYPVDYHLRQLRTICQSNFLYYSNTLLNIIWIPFRIIWLSKWIWILPYWAKWRLRSVEYKSCAIFWEFFAYILTFNCLPLIKDLFWASFAQSFLTVPPDWFRKCILYWG